LALGLPAAPRSFISGTAKFRSARRPDDERSWRRAESSHSGTFLQLQQQHSKRMHSDRSPGCDPPSSPLRSAAPCSSCAHVLYLFIFFCIVVPIPTLTFFTITVSISIGIAVGTSLVLNLHVPLFLSRAGLLFIFFPI